MNAKVGGILKGFEVHRKNGSIERYDKPLHNFITHTFLEETNLFTTSTSVSWISTVRLVLSSEPNKVLLSGGYSQSGTTLSRSSGEDLLGNSVYVWESTGEWVNTNTSGSTSSRTASKSLTVPSGTSNLWMFRVSKQSGSAGVFNGADIIDDISTFIPRTKSYLNGVFTITNDDIILSDAIANNSSLVHGVGLFATASARGHWFDFEDPISMDREDRIVIRPNDFIVTWTFDDYAPRALPTCPLTGLTTECIAQRLFPFSTGVSSQVNDGQGSNRIWLITAANAMTIPSDIGLISSIIAPASITPLETITATGTFINPTLSNEHIRENKAVGTVVTGGLIKQIVWGNTTQLFGVIEFVTPQTINPGQIITIGGRLKINQDYIVP